MVQRTNSLIALLVFASLATATEGMNATWGNTLQSLFNNGLGDLFGSNILLVGAFFLVLSLFAAAKLGVGMELAAPFGIAVVFLLVIINPGMLPPMFWTAVLVTVGLIVANSVRKSMGGGY